MSSMSVSPISSPRPAAYAAARNAENNQIAEQAARQQKSEVQERLAVQNAQEAADTRDRQAQAARDQAALVQAASGGNLNVYA